MNAPPSFRTLARTAALAGALALAGCASLVGGGNDRNAIYAPTPAVRADAAWPQAPWQLVVSTTSATAVTDSQRIAVRPQPNELQVYKDANWARRPTEMVEDVVLRTLESSNKVGAVARVGSGVNADYRLVLDLRRFESDYRGAATPAAVVEINAKLLHAIDDRVVASRTFVQTQPAASTEVPVVVDAFGAALADAGHDIAGWALTAGQAHRHETKR
ncbi:ABC-type transport auxiliary lipoprotein family protein [Cognatilysobacter bugurensis]|uniref:ABC transporter n=1 Tax=Cognatilysobacter bugurensis TaxID=543356 RepID=A0A918T2U5_9GAMM|nr:ABC-type transport auxiliary lipoprotein family protein [Lysobacter bugurensis]GHA85549.1 ABC transporter [Lysobacter bugurensis]